MLRLDVLDREGRGEDDSYEVSILVDPGKTRLGIGGAALRLGRRLVPSSILYASVHPENTASQRLFAGEGYVQSDDGYL